MDAAGLRLVQVTDCHLSADPDAAYRDRSPDAGLARLAPAVRAFAPDWLVLTGDLSEDASTESYRRIVAWASEFGVPVAWLPGNHDDRRVMAPIFDAAGFESGPRIRASGWDLVLLDSAVPGRPEGHLDEPRLAVLEELSGRRPAGVFVHHQPVAVGAAWIDRVGLVDGERLWERLGRVSGLRFVAFGHIHQRFRGQRGDVACLAAPSTAANSISGRERFTPGEPAPLARWFRLARDGGFASGILGAA